MATINSGRLGIARTYALVFGIAYLAVALLEVILGSGGLTVGDAVILRVTPVQNAIHWIVGLVVLGSFFAGEAAARTVAQAIGIVFVIVTALGFVARDLTGQLLGFDGPLPWTYNIVHLATAVVALFAGFAAERAYSRTA
ncbi:MAG TPA: DUF4383 domain-containing protein [Actinomycetota bacterium]|nr:DUF4383 domain-containing protein [Actinomycetota bacterium]